MKKIVALLCCMAMLIALCGCTNKDTVKEELLGYLEEYEFANAYELLQGQKEDVCLYVEADVLKNLEHLFTHTNFVDQSSQEDVAIVNQIIKLLPSQSNEKNQEISNMYEMLAGYLEREMLWSEYDACFEQYGDIVNLDFEIIERALIYFSKDSWSEFQKAVNDLESIAQKIRYSYDTNDERCGKFLNTIETCVTGGNAMISGQKMSDDTLWEEGKENIIDSTRAMGDLSEEKIEELDFQNEFLDFLIDTLENSVSLDDGGE